MDYQQWALKMAKYGGWRRVQSSLYLQHDYNLSAEKAKDILNNLYEQKILLKKCEYRCPECRDTNVCFESEIGTDIYCGECDFEFSTKEERMINYYFVFDMKHEIFKDFFKKS